jgi:DNA-binding transcriptional MerR regulator
MQTSGTEVQVPVDQRHFPSLQKTSDRLLSIGVFARRSRLSTKALRLYDRLGVLTPAHVDQVSGYRRYRESQLATARLVAMLRRLDMPLSLVAEVVSAVGTQDPEVAMLRRPEMSPREVYFTDFGSAAPTDEVCDVAFPVRSA